MTPSTPPSSMLSTRLHQLGQLLSLEFSPLLPPWSRLRTTASPAGRLRRTAVRISWDTLRSRKARLALGALAVLWPLFALVRALGLVLREGAATRQRSGRSLVRQLRDCTHLSMRFNIDPRSYYLYRMFVDLSAAPQYIQVMEMAALQHGELNGADLGVLNDKARFFESCEQHDLCTAPLLARLGPGLAERWYAGHQELPQADLFLKWNSGEHGTGAERWSYDPRAEGWSRQGVTRNRRAFLEYSRARSSDRALLLQLALSNHPDLFDLCGDTVSTIRVLTVKEPDAPAVVVRVSFKIAAVGSDVDNVSAGGMAAAVDTDTGDLGVARGARVADGEHTFHPRSHAPICGRRLPDVPEALALACRAHDQLPVPWSVGWDIALSPTGPVLLEGNPYWSSRILQLSHGAPLPEWFLRRLWERIGALSH